MKKKFKLEVLRKDHEIHVHCPNAYKLKFPPCCCLGHPCPIAQEYAKRDKSGSIVDNLVTAKEKGTWDELSR